MFYQITSRENGTETVTVVLGEGEVLALPSTDGGYAALVAAVREQAPLGAGADEALIRRLATPGAEVAAALETQASERITMRDGKVYFDGEKVRGRIAKHLKRMAKTSDPHIGALSAFLEKVSANPSEESRKALYRWLSDRDFTIADDGDFIAYKGLTAAGMSIHAGTAWVNGLKIDGQIPNPVGAVVTMPRDTVDPDRLEGCSYGLHAGTWDYAYGFSQGMTVTVKIDPADVVSVPDDCTFSKLRVSRYTVLESAVQELKIPVLSGYSDGGCDCDCICDGCGDHSDSDGCGCGRGVRDHYGCDDYGCGCDRGCGAEIGDDYCPGDCGGCDSGCGCGAYGDSTDDTATDSADTAADADAAPAGFACGIGGCGGGPAVLPYDLNDDAPAATPRGGPGRWFF